VGHIRASAARSATVPPSIEARSDPPDNPGVVTSCGLSTDLHDVANGNMGVSGCASTQLSRFSMSRTAASPTPSSAFLFPRLSSFLNKTESMTGAERIQRSSRSSSTTLVSKNSLGVKERVHWALERAALESKLDNQRLVAFSENAVEALERATKSEYMHEEVKTLVDKAVKFLKLHRNKTELNNDADKNAFEFLKSFSTPSSKDLNAGADTSQTSLMTHTHSRISRTMSKDSSALMLSSEILQKSLRLSTHQSEDAFLQKESSAIKLSSNFEPINPDDDYVGSILKRFKSQLPIEKPLSSELQVELNKMGSWVQFDIFKVAELCSHQPLVPVALHIMDEYSLLEAFQIPRAHMVAFLSAVEAVYCFEGNPYHNSTHAADVIQSMAVLMGPWGLHTHLSIEELFACLLSAIVHDVGHPGVSNEFQVNIRHPRATIYNDVSVNESFHAATAFRIAEDPRWNIFANMNDKTYVNIRRMIIQMVIGTDMCHHFENLTEFQTNFELSSNMREWSCTLPALKLLMHASDISNPGKPVEWAVRWAKLISSEFYLQGDKERERGMPVSPLCDRTNYLLPRSQLGFIEFIVQPTFEALGGLSPQIVSELLPCLEKTRQHWAELVKEMDEKENRDLARSSNNDEDEAPFE